jgi:transcriptional regulator with GAF, ATPase, and Fis domain/tetratricopeptide (TPR) repeat protein
MSPELADELCRTLDVGASSVAVWPYRVLERAGRGGSATVWLAHDERGSRLALKVGHEPTERARFAEEAMRLTLAVSPALPALLDIGLVPASACAALGVCPDAPFLALEWVDGTPLEPTSLPDAERTEVALVVARDLGRALSDLHSAGLAHGDVKPHNVLFDRRSGRARPVDLGLSELVSERRVVGGTPRYLAPEHRSPGLGSDARARDLWALGLLLAELASPIVARSDRPAECALELPLDARVARIVRALLRSAAGARPAADWVHRQAATALGWEETPEERRLRAAASLRRAYTSVRRPWLERVALGDTLELRVSGQAHAWLAQAAAVLTHVARVSGVPDPQNERRHHVVEDLGALDQERLLLRWIGPSEGSAAALAAPTDAALLARLERSISEQSPRNVEGLVLSPAARDERHLDGDDPVALAIALGEGVPSAGLLERAERYLGRHPDAHALGLLLARALCLGHQLGRALAILDQLGGLEAQVEAAEIARRADDDVEAERRLDAVDCSEGSARVQARARATRARLALKLEDIGRARVLLEGAPDAISTLEASAMLFIRTRDYAAADACLRRARSLGTRPDELARLEFLMGRIAHGRHQYAEALECFARAAEHAVRAGAILEEATYLSGVAAAATELGRLSQALHAAGRALILYEFLGHPERAARAALSRAGVLLVANAVDETIEAAEVALGLARQSGDQRCQAYAHLALAEASTGDKPHDAALHLARARQLVHADGSADDLRIAAIELELGRELDLTQCDLRASDPNASAEARLGYWGARARQLCRQQAPLRGAEIAQKLTLLVSAHASVGVRGPAFAAGARLCTLLGDGEQARRFALLASEALGTLRRSAPPELTASLDLASWTTGLVAPLQLHVAPEQVRDVDTLVRALTNRTSLRSLLNQVLDALVLWTSVERGLLLLTAPGGRLVPRAARNLQRVDLVGPQLALSYSLAERAIATREPVVAVDAAFELPEHHESVHALKLRSLLAIPLFFKGDVLGVVYLDDRVRAGAFGPEELAWVRLVASIASVAIGDARDQLRLRRAARRAERAELKLSVALGESEAKLDVAEQRLAQRDPAERRFRYDRIVGQSEAIETLLALVDRVTPTDVPVLVLGESGAGKELVARALHDNGPRKERPFISENCSAIPETLLESTLFGHVRGAFTGAARGHAGLFSVAHRGTLFLDEIGEMSLAMQAKLLRVLQTGEIRPLGAERNLMVDVRVIGATQRDLEAMVRAGAFREDLYYRLNVVSMKVPPLRERRSDILLLMNHFLVKHVGDVGSKGGKPPRLSEDAVRCLENYAWPGNVRELENEARRALVMAADVITQDHLSARLQGKPQTPPGVNDLNMRARVDLLETELVRTALDKTQGNQTRAAELLGLSRFGLQKMMKRLHIGRPQS